MSATAPEIGVGLTAAEVEERRAAGKVNVQAAPGGRSVRQIVRANVVTPINAIVLALFGLILLAGFARDGLFVAVVVSNSVIGVIQEVRARRELERLEVLVQPTATVRRDGEESTIDSATLVLDDLVVLAPGDQADVDGTLLSSAGLQMDESALTGESRPVAKAADDTVLSGSFVVAGSGVCRTTAVGTDAYAASLTSQAREFKAVDSKLRGGVDRILSWLTFIIPISSALLLFSQLRAQDKWQDALQGTVAAAIAMVPQGLVLLTSLAFMAGSVQLLRRKALAKQLTTVEVLARVDVICLDKTGTITTGDITLTEIRALDGQDTGTIRRTLAELAATDPTPNATMSAIATDLDVEPSWTVVQAEPFSSARKFSAASFADEGWFYLGAPDVLLPDDHPARDQVDELTAEGGRVLALIAASEGPDGDRAPTGEAQAIIALDDEIRADAPDVLAYFAEQKVTVKVISGDNHDAVAAIAARAGLSNPQAVDARTLPKGADDPALGEALDANDVFGRVTPDQKQAMVAALQAQGHVVAMTGDGVNDILALKDANLGIAMGSGSAACKAVADLVLTDDAFSSLPVVVDEGRKVINNVERVANLFLTKSAYAVLLTFAIGLLGSPFPFLPRQLTLIGVFSIGLPGFFLALAPEVDRVRPGFLRRTLWFSIPAGIIAGSSTLAVYEFARRSSALDLTQARTLATVTMLGIGLAILATVSRPLRPWKIGLVAFMAVSYGAFLTVGVFQDYFEMRPFADAIWILAAVAVLGAGAAIWFLPRRGDPTGFFQDSSAEVSAGSSGGTAADGGGR